MATLSSVVTAAVDLLPRQPRPARTPSRSSCRSSGCIAKLPTIAAYAYKKSIGQPFIYPNNELDLIENFLHHDVRRAVGALRGQPGRGDALKQLLILHADHEQNCSTSTVRLVGSSEANLYASIAAGINALWGPLHGGANQEASSRCSRPSATDGGDVEQVRRHGEGPERRLPAVGLRAPRLQELRPRATILKETCRRGARRARRRDHLLDIALELEEVALSDEYFIERKLYPNVDFYSGLIYRAMGFPTHMFTVLFAIGRLPAGSRTGRR